MFLKRKEYEEKLHQLHIELVKPARNWQWPGLKTYQIMR